MAAGRFFPLPFCGQADTPVASPPQGRGQQVAPIRGLGSQPAAESDGRVPTHILTRVIPKGETLRIRPLPYSVRRVQSRPPTPVAIAIFGVDKRLKLAIGDRVTRHPKGRFAAPFALLVDKLTLPCCIHFRRLYPIDVGQAVRAQPDPAARVVFGPQPQKFARYVALLRLHLFPVHEQLERGPPQRLKVFVRNI